MLKIQNVGYSFFHDCKTNRKTMFKLMLFVILYSNCMLTTKANQCDGCREVGKGMEVFTSISTPSAVYKRLTIQTQKKLKVFDLCSSTSPMDQAVSKYFWTVPGKHPVYINLKYGSLFPVYYHSLRRNKLSWDILLNYDFSWTLCPMW